MNYLQFALAAFGTFVFLFILTKILGNRQMSQLSMFDYVSSITIGSIAGEMAVMSTESFFEPLVSMLVFGALSLFISYGTCKSILLRRFFEGHTVLLYQNGHIYEKNLLKAKIDIDEFLSAVREMGYYDLEEIHTIFLEANGKLSVLPMAKSRPVTPSDLNLSPVQTLPLANVIIDGRILPGNLKFAGKNEAWVNKQLKAHMVKDIREVILATYDSNSDALNIYVKLHKKMNEDIFE